MLAHISRDYSLSSLRRSYILYRSCTSLFHRSIEKLSKLLWALFDLWPQFNASRRRMKSKRVGSRFLLRFGYSFKAQSSTATFTCFRSSLFLYPMKARFPSTVTVTCRVPHTVRRSLFPPSFSLRYIPTHLISSIIEEDWNAMPLRHIISRTRGMMQILTCVMKTAFWSSASMYPHHAALSTNFKNSLRAGRICSRITRVAEMASPLTRYMKTFFFILLIYLLFCLWIPPREYPKQKR